VGAGRHPPLGRDPERNPRLGRRVDHRGWVPDQPVGGTVEVDDQFGAEISTGDFDNDGIAELAAGAPAEDVGSIFNAGAVSAGALLFTQNSPGVPGTAEDFDSFGGNAFNSG